MRIRGLPSTCLMLALMPVPSHRGAAQSANDSRATIVRHAPAGRVRGAWVSGAAGLASDGDEFASSVGVHLQRDRFLLSGRMDARGGGGPSAADAIGVLLGIAKASRPGAAALSGGVSYVDVRGYFDRVAGAHRHTVGATIAGDVALRAGRRGGVGIGLTAFAQMNSLASFAGIGLDLSVGRWR